MKAILMEINWTKEKGFNNFCEMTEIAAIQLQVVDGILIEGGSFHSFIRPVFSPWKKENHPNYSDWWLASTFPSVMRKFTQWYESLGDIPWIVWNDYLFTILVMNMERHNYFFHGAKRTVFLQNELKKRKRPYHFQEVVLNQIKDKEKSGQEVEILASEKIAILRKMVVNTMNLNELTMESFTFKSNMRRKMNGRHHKDLVITKLIGLLKDGDITIDDIAEWSRLSKDRVVQILSSNTIINDYYRKQLNEAWTMWITIEEMSREFNGKD
ncbi:hypothetical protein QA612_02480 [Evansella sp. AB-P1]|uniref:hypothetical protein n=1 Tax=Evansella sp. AB-P1 TaxID=3037653 RepID=UPI00241D8A33|nr:hypothetical protein [Evansella sp. AB-P1]MDG5786341.1 hypothetical protein [Evansella sp. AB-P1]